MDFNTLLPYFYGVASVNLIVLLWMSYMVWKTKRLIQKEIGKNENQDY